LSNTSTFNDVLRARPCEYGIARNLTVHPHDTPLHIGTSARRWASNRYEPDGDESANQQPGRIELAESSAKLRRAWVSVMVVVEALASSHPR
jgi:hypothetical protein